MTEQGRERRILEIEEEEEEKKKILALARAMTTTTSTWRGSRNGFSLQWVCCCRKRPMQQQQQPPFHIYISAERGGGWMDG